MTRFHYDNTEGYDVEDLAILNATWESLPISVADDTDIAIKSVQDHIAERLLFDFDRGLRGEALTAWYFS